MTLDPYCIIPPGDYDVTYLGQITRDRIVWRWSLCSPVYGRTFFKDYYKVIKVYRVR